MPRKTKGTELSPSVVTTAVETLRGMQELPQLLHFVVSQKDRFGFSPIDIEILEESFTESEDFLIADLFARLLRHILKKREIRICSYTKHLQELLTERNASFNPLKGTEIDKLSPADKLKLLKWTADQTKDNVQEDKDGFPVDAFDSANPEEGIIDAGQDSENRTYWYFEDLRLYRAGAQNRDWQCAAVSLQDWENLLKQFKKQPEEQELYSFLSDHLFPPIKTELEKRSQPGASRLQKPSDDVLIKKEETDIEKMMKHDSSAVVDPTAQIKSENPELSRVLSEEPSKAKEPSNPENVKGRSNGLGDTKGEFKGNACAQSGKPPQESPFSHQQNQVFVFSTSMANKAADAVISGQAKSIISYHMEDPETKKFLQKHPMKLSPHLLQGGSGPHHMPPARPAFNPAVNGGPQWPGPNSNIPPNQSPGPNWNGGPMRPMAPGGQYRPESPYGHPMQGMPPHGGPDISQSIVPDENLTPEQLQKREDGLASLRKIHQMLLAEENNLPTNMNDFHHISMAQDGHHPGGPPMGPMGPGVMGPNGPGGPADFPGGMYNPNIHNMDPNMPPQPHPMHSGPMPPHPQHMGGDPGMNQQMMHQKPPPPYPSAPSMPSPAPPAPTKSKKRKPSVQSPAPASPQSLKSPKYSIPPSPLAQPGPMTPQALPPGAMPSFPQPGGGPGFPQDMPAHTGTPPQAYNHAANSQANSQGGNLMQAGPPEPFQSHPASVSVAPGQKPPPSYSQSTNKRGSVESMTTPPTQHHYYSQFENQELTIIKQRNSSFQEGSMPPQGGPGQNQPGDMPAYQTQTSRPGGPPSNRSMNPGSPLVSRSSSMNNITSASLAHLARGVEQNLSQMQQTMLQGGPFKEVQQQQQQQQTGQGPAGMGGPSPMHSQNGSMPGPGGGPSTPSSAPSMHSVNNTFVNAHMSIGQVNIQNVNASQQHASFDANGRPTHMQQNVGVSMNTGGSEPTRFPEEGPQGPRAPGPSVKVQNKGPNTIQYLPVSQPTLPSNEPPMLPQKPGFDYERFASPLTNLDSKTPTSKLNYFPDNARPPPPAPQRMPTFSSSPISMSSGGPPMTSQGMYSHPHGGPPPPGMHPGIPMHPHAAMSPSHMPPHPSHGGPPGGPPGHPMMMGQHPPPGMNYNGGPPPPQPGPQTPTMMEPMHSPHMHNHPMMMQQGGPTPPHHVIGSPSPYGLPGGPEFGPPMQGGYPGEMISGPGGGPPPRGQHPHHGPHPHMHPHMMMSQQGPPGFMNGPPGPGPPYMMG